MYANTCARAIPIDDVIQVNHAIQLCDLINETTTLDSVSMQTNTYKLQASCNDEFVAALPSMLQKLHPSLVPLCFQGMLAGSPAEDFANIHASGATTTTAANAANGRNYSTPLGSEAFELLPLRERGGELGAQTDGLPSFGRRTQGFGSTHGTGQHGPPLFLFVCFCFCQTHSSGRDALDMRCSGLFFIRICRGDWLGALSSHSL